MSRHKRRYARCQGKVSYPSERAALRAAARCAQARGTQLRVYYHERCECWHLTRQARRPGDALIVIEGQEYAIDTENLETWQ